MQSSLWADFKSRTGWKAFVVDVSDEPSGYRGHVLVLVRHLALGFRFAYVPHGPESVPPGIRPSDYLEILGSRIAAGLDRSILFVRFDLPWEKGALGIVTNALRTGTRLVSGTAVQVPDTVVLDLTPSEDEILAGMKPKWRYNIRLAEKKGVEVKEEGRESLGVFYELYRETSERDGIAIHPLSYYRTLFEMADGQGGDGNAPSAEDKAVPGLWVARHEGEALAAIITLFRGRQAVYLYGASSGKKRNLMPAYALQWRAIRAAREAHCASYDFFGIPPDDDPGHPMAGLYLFKTGFGGALVHREGSVDYPASVLLYALYRTAESLRLLWFKRIRKFLRRRSARGPETSPAAGAKAGVSDTEKDGN